MIVLLQRVSSASVSINAKSVAAIQQGLLALVGFQPGDSQQQIDKMLAKIIHYRIFEDSDEKMNLSVSDIKGELVIVPQFTLAADTKKGLRPGFSTAANPTDGERLFKDFVATAKNIFPKVQQGEFGSNMDVTLTNTGPATFWLEVR
jgi:D-tyrosyl-tRNA(Tyr) deacylase